MNKNTLFNNSTNLLALAFAIESSKGQMKLNVAKPISSLDIALKTAKLLDEISHSDLTSWAGKLGKKILLGYEDETMTTKEARKLNIQVGLWVVRVLRKMGVANYYRADYEKHQYKLTETEFGKEFIDQILLDIPAGARNLTGEPSLYKPELRTGFFDKIAGPLVSRYDQEDIPRWSYNSIPKVYNIVNKLQQTPYDINTELLDVLKVVKKDLGWLWKIKKGNAKGDVAEGLMLEERMTLQYADEVKYHPFYYYWNLDFRGRKYVMASYLTPQGGKLAKGLLKLSNKKALGSEGWYWLLVHAANCLGYDKLDIHSRYQKIAERLPEVIKMATEASVDRSWMDADDPFGYLAACIEIKNAVNSGNKEAYESGLMIGFDATTSGLQILSLLSEDEITGRLCNLTDADTVGDSYKFIADGVWGDMDDNDFWMQHFDRRRSIVKRSVMVKYYQCGRSKMGEHIYSDEKFNIEGLTQEQCTRLGGMIYDKCEELLPGPTRVMDLLTKVGEKDADDNIHYTYVAPYDQFELVQRYTKDRADSLIWRDGDRRMKIRYISEPSAYLNRGKVITGTSVNTIHCLDSQIVSYLVDNVEYDICPVHDCFSAVPADAGKLFEDARTSLYEVFKGDVLTDLLDQKEYEGDSIEYGNLDKEWLLDNEWCIS